MLAKVVMPSEQTAGALSIGNRLVKTSVAI